MELNIKLWINTQNENRQLGIHTQGSHLYHWDGGSSETQGSQVDTQIHNFKWLKVKQEKILSSIATTYIIINFT